MGGRVPEGVISEVIDGEVVAIDLTSGVYYNLRGSAVHCWQGVAADLSDDQVVAKLMARYEIDEAGARACVDSVVAQFVEYGLLAEGSTSPSPGTTEVVVSPPHEPRIAFEPPAIDRFDEMFYVLGLDPIHQVDPEAGWPTPA